MSLNEDRTKWTEEDIKNIIENDLKMNKEKYPRGVAFARAFLNKVKCISCLDTSYFIIRKVTLEGFFFKATYKKYTCNICTNECVLVQTYDEMEDAIVSSTGRQIPIRTADLGYKLTIRLAMMYKIEYEKEDEAIVDYEELD